MQHKLRPTYAITSGTTTLRFTTSRRQKPWHGTFAADVAKRLTDKGLEPDGATVVRVITDTERQRFGSGLPSNDPVGELRPRSKGRGGWVLSQ